MDAAADPADWSRHCSGRDRARGVHGRARSWIRRGRSLRRAAHDKDRASRLRCHRDRDRRTRASAAVRARRRPTIACRRVCRRKSQHHVSVIAPGVEPVPAGASDSGHGRDLSDCLARDRVERGSRRIGRRTVVYGQHDRGRAGRRARRLRVASNDWTAEHNLGGRRAQSICGGRCREREPHRAGRDPSGCSARAREAHETCVDQR